MLTLDEYKTLIAPYLAQLTESEIATRFERDRAFAAFVIKTWLAARRQSRVDRGRVAPPS